MIHAPVRGADMAEMRENASPIAVLDFSLSWVKVAYPARGKQHPMSLMTQITLGSVLLIVCTLVHVSILAIAVTRLEQIGLIIARSLGPRIRVAMLFAIGLAFIIGAHTVQIWAWAAAFWLMTSAATFEAAFYFATVTYTTLGYGDIVPDIAFRVFATFAAITGLLTFGVSTAFLFGIAVRVMPDVFTTGPSDE